MRTTMTFSLAGIFAMALTGAALAQDAYPDLKGTWVGQGAAVVVGTPKHHEKGAKTPRYSEQTFTLKITDQKDGRFWGTVESPKGKETLIGVLASDKKHVLIAGDVGTASGTMMDANTFEWCYDQHTKDSIVVACNTVRRQAK